jgi:hypothetical protein
MSHKQYLLTIAVLFLLATIITARVFDEDVEESNLVKSRFAARHLKEPLFDTRDLKEPLFDTQDLEEPRFDTRDLEEPRFSARDLFELLMDKRMLRPQTTLCTFNKTAEHLIQNP